MNKSFTNFGLFFSKLRKSKKETIKEAASKLGVSIAYISSVEHGNREIPHEWITKIPKIYSLTSEEEHELKEAYYNTKSLKRISLEDIKWCMTNMINNIIKDEKERKECLKNLDKRLEELRIK